nr:ATP synthase F0 subunit 8 [Sorineuchora shanensis]
MPQMMPLMWLTLFIMFTIIMIMFNSMNYFMNIPMKSTILNKMTHKKKMKWLW